MEREELHGLVDTLPEGALEHAKNMLVHLQTWPPVPPPEIERINRLQEDRLRTLRPGTGGGGGGGGSYTLGQGGRVRNGHYSFGYDENGTVVRETHHFHEGVEITITERMRLGVDRKALIYANEISGPDGKHYTQNITFGVDGRETPTS